MVPCFPLWKPLTIKCILGGKFSGNNASENTEVVFLWGLEGFILVMNLPVLLNPDCSGGRSSNGAENDRYGRSPRSSIRRNPEINLNDARDQARCGTRIDEVGLPALDHHAGRTSQFG